MPLSVFIDKLRCGGTRPALFLAKRHDFATLKEDISPRGNIDDNLLAPAEHQNGKTMVRVRTGQALLGEPSQQTRLARPAHSSTVLRDIPTRCASAHTEFGRVMKIVRGGERQAYKPGDLVPTSGIYTAVHELHRRQHDVLALKTEEFPLCRICKARVRFYVARLIPHMTHDFDLTGPDASVLTNHARAAKTGSD